MDYLPAPVAAAAAQAVPAATQTAAPIALMMMTKRSVFIF